MARRRTGGQDYQERAARALLAAAQLLLFSPHQLRELHAAITGAPEPKYRSLHDELRGRNPAHRVPVDDPHLQEVSRRFHGTEETAVLDQDQMPPREVVVVGKLEGIDYEADRASRRAGKWHHEAGDRGDDEPMNKGRGLVVTDGERVWMVPANGPRFDKSRGIVG